MTQAVSSAKGANADQGISPREVSNKIAEQHISSQLSKMLTKAMSNYRAEVKKQSNGGGEG